MNEIIWDRRVPSMGGSVRSFSSVHDTIGFFVNRKDYYFDLDAVRADLDSIAALGLDHVRVFALWPYFQPDRALIRPRAVDQLVQLVDAAAERGLDVNVDGLQGHLSSFDYLPAWTRTWHRRNLFTDPEILDGQAAYLHTLAAALAARGPLQCSAAEHPRARRRRRRAPPAQATHTCGPRALTRTASARGGPPALALLRRRIAREGERQRE